MDDFSGRDDGKHGEHAAGPTIVGGRPLRGGRQLGGIPRGIEVLVKKASVDPEFRKALLERRARAAEEIGLELSAAEAAMLDSVPRSQIEQIIENTTVPDEHRRVFLGRLAAAMLAVLGVGLSACGQVYSWGARPEKVEARRIRGIRPDPPPVPPPPKDSVSVVPAEPRKER